MKKRFNIFIWLSAASFFIGLFAKITKGLFDHGGLIEIDNAILLFIEKIRINSMNGMAVDITALGSPIVITIFTIIASLVLLFLKDRYGIIYLISSSLGAGAWSLILKYLVARDRPMIIPRLVEVSGNSYPSGHTLAASSFYLSIAILSSRYFKAYKTKISLLIISMILTGLVGFTRIYLGVHYPSDVLSGVFFGFAWTLFLTGNLLIKYSTGENNVTQENNL